MSEVWLHVYDVTNTMSPKTNSTILGINRIFKDGIGIGGIFHGAVQVYDEEWSFGYCDSGSGVFGCAPKENPMYTFRESVFIGSTALTPASVNQILLVLSREWPGYSYDLLARNCNHFCSELCERLGVPKPPAWINRFANAGDATVEAVGNTMERLKQAKTDVAAAGKIAIRFLFGGINRSGSNGEAVEQGSSTSSSLRGFLSRVRTFPQGSSVPSSDEENGGGPLNHLQNSLTQEDVDEEEGYIKQDLNETSSLKDSFNKYQRDMPPSPPL